VIHSATIVRVLGIGHPDRGDDAAGLHVAGLLRGTMGHDVEVRECLGSASELLEAWRDAGAVIVVDCVVSGAPPGTLHRVDALREPLPALSATSTHGFGLAQAVALGRILGQLPPVLIVHGIEGIGFAVGESLSDCVRLGLAPLAEAVAGDAARLVDELHGPTRRAG
jgi:hydrogenase maturation protease